MRVKRVDEILNRLIDILAYKKINYQTKLGELDKKREIERILSRYPKEPFRGLVELDLSEIMVLLSYFTNEEYDADDIQLKKFWMIEANNNDALKDNSRYKDANKLFIRLGDKLQEYLENLKDIDISEKDIKEKLNIVLDLDNHLSDAKIIDDLSLYYPILSLSETLVEEDIYKFLIALAVKNIDILQNGKKKSKTKSTIAKQTVKQLEKMLENRINELENEKNKFVINNKKLDQLASLRQKVAQNYDCIIDVYPTEIEQTMHEVYSDDVIEEQIDRLMVPITVIKGKRQGIKIDFNNDEKKIIDDFLQLLKVQEDKLRLDEDNAKKEKEEKIISEMNSLSKTISKFKDSNKEYFDVDDFNNIVNILISQEQSFDDIKKIINSLNLLNLTMGKRKIEPEEPIILEEKESLDVRLIDLFTKYNLDYHHIPNRLINNLINNTSYEHLDEMLDYLTNKIELSFMKDYVNYPENTQIQKRIHDMKCSQLCYVLAYSSKKILDNLLSLSKQYNISLDDLFAIPRVFGSKNDGGTFENVTNNLKYLESEYQEIFYKIVKRSPAILGVEPSLLHNNIAATKIYNMNIIADRKGAFPSPRALAASNFEYVIDRYIEAGEYDYVERFRSQLETNYVVALRLKYLQLKGIDFRSNGFVEIEKQFDLSLDRYLRDLSLENIPVAINDIQIKWLDSINEEADFDKRNVQYVLGGIYISRPKVLKYYSTMLINNCPDKKLALFYSLTKDSYLTSEEFEKLKALIYDREDM